MERRLNRALRRLNEGGVRGVPGLGRLGGHPQITLTLKTKKAARFNNQSISTELRPFVIIQFYFNNKRRVVKAGRKLLLMILRLNIPASNLGRCLLSFQLIYYMRRTVQGKFS